MGLSTIILDAGSNLVGQVELSDGTNVIGVSGHPVVVDGSAVTQPVSGQVSASNETSTIYEGTTPLTPVKASFAVSSSGATTVVSATSGKKIRVLQWEFTVATAVNVNLQSHTTTSTTSGVKYAAANGGGVYSFSPIGWFDTATSEALDINLSAAENVGGSLVYVLV